MTAWPSRDVLRVILLVAGVYLAFQLLWVARSVFVLGFLGVLFGITLSAGVTWLQRRGLPRAVGAVILMGAVLALLVGLGAVVAPRMTEQWEDLQHQLPGDAVDESGDGGPEPLSERSWTAAMPHMTLIVPHWSSAPRPCPRFVLG